MFVVPLAMAALSIYGSMKEAKARKNAAKAQANLQRMQALSVIVRGRAEASRTFAAFSARAEEARGAFASSNVDVRSGVARVAQEQFGAIGKIEAGTIKRNAQEEANLIYAGAANTQAAGNAQYNAAMFGLAGTALGGIAQSYSMYNRN